MLHCTMLAIGLCGGWALGWSRESKSLQVSGGKSSSTPSTLATNLSLKSLVEIDESCCSYLLALLLLLLQWPFKLNKVYMAL